MTKTTISQAKRELAHVKALRSKISMLKSAPKGTEGEAIYNSLIKSEGELQQKLNMINEAIARLDSPRQAMLADILFNYSFDRDLLISSLGGTRSTFYKRQRAALDSLDAILKDFKES